MEIFSLLINLSLLSAAQLTGISAENSFMFCKT